MARIATAPLMAALVLILCELAATKDLKVFRRGKVQIVDETQLNNPTEYSFDEDLQKSADLEDAYDELVPYLPRFDLIKNGKFAGYTRIPIVTRKQSTWSTPRPVTKKGEQYKTWGTPYIIPVTRPPRRFETKVRSEPVKVEERLPVQADSKEVSTILKTTTTVPTTTTTQSTTVPTTTTTQTTITDAPTTTSTSTEASTTPTQAPFRNEVIVKLEKPSTRSWVDIPLQSDSQEERVANLHFSKFAQRFGVNRVIPNSATTPQTTIVINELIAKNNPLISASISASGFPVSTQQKVRSNQVILEPAPRNFPVPVKALPVASQPFVEATTRRPVPVAHPTPVKKVTTTSTEAPTTEALTTQATTTQAPLPSPCSKSLPCEGCAGSSPCSRRPSPIPLPSPCSSGSSFGSSPCSSPCSSSEASSPCAATLRPFRSRPRNPALGPAAPKPPIIHHGNSPYRGPTFNCRILNPVQDGRPHPRTDPTCALSMPGFSADGSCRCTYEVAGRDEDGCATGFLYICKRR